MLSSRERYCTPVVAFLRNLNRSNMQQIMNKTSRIYHLGNAASSIAEKYNKGAERCLY